VIRRQVGASGAFTSLERWPNLNGISLANERTQAGLQAARARGHHGGRPTIMAVRKVALAQSLYCDRHSSPREICTTLRISKTTLYRYLPREAKNHT
jgi:DNA invertase Pin-like site-specific DNA recombinase